MLRAGYYRYGFMTLILKILNCVSLLVGGILRGIEFIYKSAGVNRPLRASEDHPHDNLNKTYYRDQINKVANAIDEILQGLKRLQSATFWGRK